MSSTFSITAKDQVTNLPAVAIAKANQLAISACHNHKVMTDHDPP